MLSFNEDKLKNDINIRMYFILNGGIIPLFTIFVTKGNALIQSYNKEMSFTYLFIQTCHSHHHVIIRKCPKNEGKIHT